MQSQRLTRQEIKHSFSIMAVFSTRMLGMFMVLPVFALHALSGAYGPITPSQIGFAIGVYGLAQALLQIPFGLLSDRFGRKPLIFFGLSLLFIGSLIAALATSIEWVIIGRLLQGSGAISSVLLALVADQIPSDKRTRAMAIIGIGIGTSFLLSLLFAPLLYTWVSMQGIFYACAILALTAMIIISRFPPSSTPKQPAIALAEFKQLLSNAQLLRLDVGILVLHAMMTALFMIIPLMLQQMHEIPVHDHWQIYTPILLGSVLVMLPLVTIAERLQRMSLVFRSSILLLALCLSLITLVQTDFWGLCAILVVLFGAFNALEASLPALVSKTAGTHHRGTAMGLYASSQFLGIFIGGALGGWLLQHHSIDTLLITLTSLCVFWLVLTYRQRFV